MAINSKTSIQPASLDQKFNIICDRIIVFAFCLSIFVLPVSIAYLESFIVLAIVTYLVKKSNQIIVSWPAVSQSNGLEKLTFILKGFAPPDNFLNRPLQFLCFGFLIAVILSQYPSLSLSAYFGKFLKCVFLYFSFIEAFKEKKHFQIFLGFLFTSALVICISGVVQHMTGKDFIKGRLIGTVNNISTHRITSAFPSPNALGAYLLPIIGIIIQIFYSSFFKSKSWLIGCAATVLMVLCLSCLCWSYSRSCWIGLIAILLMMVLLDRKKIFFIGIIFLIFIYVFLPSLNNARNLYLLNDNNLGKGANNGSILNNIKPHLSNVGSGRVVFWKSAISIIRTSPIYGTGLNTYTRIIKRDPNPNTWWYAHNCYLQMAAETGLLGLSCFLGLLFVFFKNGFYYSHQIKDLWVLTLLQGSLSGLFGFLIQSLFDNTLYTVQLGVFLWIIFGFTVALTRLKLR